MLVLFGPLFALALRVGFMRRIIQKILPGSGQGPSREERENGSYELQFYATAETEPYDHPVRVHGVVKGKPKEKGGLRACMHTCLTLS